MLFVEKCVILVKVTQTKGKHQRTTCATGECGEVRLRSITCKRKALSKRINASRPCAAGCGNARHNRRRSATANAIALEVAPWPVVIQKPRAAMQALQGKHRKQQCKRYRANAITANSKNKLQGKRPCNRNLLPCPTTSHKRTP